VCKWLCKINLTYSYILENNAIIPIIRSYSVNYINKKIDSQCVICITKTNNCETNCGHDFCYSCITQWCDKHETCPMCRVTVSVISKNFN